jgi:hypothetical protein
MGASADVPPARVRYHQARSLWCCSGWWCTRSLAICACRGGRGLRNPLMLQMCCSPIVRPAASRSSSVSTVAREAPIPAVGVSPSDGGAFARHGTLTRPCGLCRDVKALPYGRGDQTSEANPRRGHGTTVQRVLDDTRGPENQGLFRWIAVAGEAGISLSVAARTNRTSGTQ